MAVAADAVLRFDGTVEHAPEIAAWLASQPASLREIGETWFRVMRSAGPGVREVFHDGLANACVGDAPFAYVGIYGGHVNVGFFRGDTLPDPARMLRGTGKRMRHVKLMPEVPFDEASLRTLIAQAHADMAARVRA